LSGGGGGGTSTSTVRTVPDWAIPYVVDYGQKAYDLWKADTLAVFAGSIIATQNADETDGIAGLANRGRYGDQVIVKAIAYLDDVINGGYLAGTKAAFLAALALVTGNSTSDFASVNSRIGRKPYVIGDPDSSFLSQSLVTGVPVLFNARLSAMIYKENWDNEKEIQAHALGFGVEMGKHAAIDAEALRRAGLYAREYLQGTYELSHKRFVEQQELSVANLEIFGNALRALTGSQQTSVQQYQGNKLMGAVGGVIAGAVIGSYFGPWGTVIGGFIGGVLGWLS
jgi:hypothetical protein